MGSQIHSHIGHSSKELVYKDRAAQGNNHMVTYDRQLPTHLCVWVRTSKCCSSPDIIKTKIFEDRTISVPVQPEWTIQLEEALECYNFASESEEADEDPRHTNIPESEGTRDVEGPQLEIPAITEPIKIKKINIGTDAEPKFASIGDYWNDETVGQIADLLHDYQDLFPTKFT